MYDRQTVPEAARLLGISEGAVRQRINRGTLEHEKDTDGRVYVHVRNIDGVQDDVQHGAYDLSTLVESLQDQVQYLRQKLDESEEANRENRRLLALQLEHMRALEPPREAPPEAPGGPHTAAEEPYGTSPQEAENSLHRRSWWQRWFGAGG
jgi:hypothetical protein